MQVDSFHVFSEGMWEKQGGKDAKWGGGKDTALLDFTVDGQWVRCGFVAAYSTSHDHMD